MIKSTLGSYEILARLGSGGMGDVYRARDCVLGREVAIKVLASHVANAPGARKRLLREARSLATVLHPCVATLFGFESDGEHDFIVMELVEGEPLSALISAGACDPDRARKILAQIVEGLAAAHEQGIVHRDLKPANIMLTSDGRVKIVDFGLAVGYDDTRITKDGCAPGTLAYMSPEQVRGETCDARSDVFSFGLVAWELLSGQRVFDADTAVALMHQISSLRQVPDLPGGAGVPDDLKQLVRSCLTPTRDIRPSHAAELLDTWFPAASTTLQLAAPKVSRRRRVWAVVGLIAIAAIGLRMGLPRWSASPSVEQAAQPAGALTAQSTIAVLPFRYLGAGAELDWLARAVPELLTSSLARSTVSEVISQERVSMILDRADHSGYDSLGLMEDAGVGYSITGSIVSREKGLRVEAQLVDNHSGAVLHSIAVDAPDTDSLFGFVSEIDQRFRQFLEVREINEQVGELWIQDLSTYSVAAYRAYARGREHLSRADWSVAVQFFSEAVTIDSTFVSAWVDLSACYWNLGDLERTEDTYAKAVQLRDRASDRERLWLDLFGATREGDGSRIILYSREMLAREPEYRFARYLLGKGHFENQQWEKAVEFWKPLRADRWEWIWTYLYSSTALVELGRPKDALRALSELESILAPTDVYSTSRLFRYRGRARTAAGQWDAAREDFARCLELDPEYFMVHFDLAQGHLARNERAKARIELELFLAGGTDGPMVEQARQMLTEVE